MYPVLDWDEMRTRPVIFFIACILFSLAAAGQNVRISGTVYDRSAVVGLAGVSIHGSSGRGAITDSAGHYSIILTLNDSLSFSYQGKSTQQFAVREIKYNRPFDVSLRVSVQVLKEVEIVTNSYRADSIAHRQEYHKYFDYSPEYLTGGGTVGAPGVNLDWLLSLKKAKRMEHFRKQLEEDEREKYINHRFNAGLIARLTGLKPPALDTFMIEYRPSYQMLQEFDSDYEYFRYIKEAGAFFSDMWEREHHTLQ